MICRDTLRLRMEAQAEHFHVGATPNRPGHCSLRDIARQAAKHVETIVIQHPGGSLLLHSWKRFLTDKGCRFGLPRIASTSKARARRTTMRNVLLSTICLLLPFFTIMPSFCQEPKITSPPATNDVLEGTVISSSRETMVVRTSDDQFRLFIFDQDTRKPRTLPPGTRVRVSSTPTDES
jgi:hypothetical protein